MIPDIKIEFTLKELEDIAQKLGEVELKAKESEKVIAVVQLFRDKYQAKVKELNEQTKE